MKSSAKNIQDKKFAKTSKVRQVARTSSVFSYSAKKVAHSLILSQLETGYVLSIKMKQLGDPIHVTEFALTRSIQLEYLSPELSDAALLEIVVQALMLLFAYAEHNKAKEIIFILDQEDAGLLTNFEYLFDDAEPLSTQNKTLFGIYITLENREFLKENVVSIKNQLKQGLWQMQRGNSYIKNFLQNHQLGTILPGVVLEAEDTSSRIGNVIPFPQGRKK